MKGPSTPSPRQRPLQVFAFDPGLGTAFGNHLTLRLPYEEMEQASGPVGRLVAVIDSDAATGRTYPGVDLDAPEILMRGGLAPSEVDIRFHQQMAYAVPMHTIGLFEVALGRPIVWPWARGKQPGDVSAKLRVYPHAEEMPNGYLLTSTGEMRFGYFRALAADGRWNLPEQFVYTCLCFGVVARQTAQALVTSVLDATANGTGDAAALLEGFSDLVALLQRFTFPELVLEVVRVSRGRIHDVDFQPDLMPQAAAAIMAELGRRNPLLELARQFGEALGTKDGLRTAVMAAPGSKLADAGDEPHSKGTVLVAAVFDAFFTVYSLRTRDLVRLAGAQSEGVELHPDLAQRLAAEAAKAAGHVLTICIRALDYCPPVGFEFGDYLRAMVTADHDSVPHDEWGYRSALIDAFRSRGIYPAGVPSAAEEALLWPAVAVDEPCAGLIVDAGTAAARSKNKRLAKAFVTKHRKALGLPPRGELKVLHVHGSQRAGYLGQVQRGFAVQVVAGAVSQNRRGATVILDENGNVRRVARASSAPSRPRPHVADVALGRVTDEDRERPLRIFAFDPSRGRAVGNQITLAVPYEPLKPGPVGGRLAVIDYDGSNDSYYPAVDLDDPRLLVEGGLEPSESDPRFHQQMVYAVVSETVRRFEYALGRPVRWRRGGWDRQAPEPTLRIFPHAMQEANAYFDPELRALLFGYFEASRVNPGANLPGQVVFTCLSHDIVAHETTHALLDTLKHHYLEARGVDVLAFHEAFADIVALFQHFSFKEALLDTIVRTGGRIFDGVFRPDVAPGPGEAVIEAQLGRDNPMVELARQFGEALGTRAALRTALGTPPNSSRMQQVFEPHDRGAILVAAIFDAFFTVYVRRTKDLLRLARFTPGAEGYVHPDLADRLAREAAKTSRHFLTICVRALDYCPPVDIEFGDFLRAIVTSDSEVVPDDSYGYRAAIIDAFRSRGIYPRAARSLSEESLRWPAPRPGEGLHLDRARLGQTSDRTRQGYDRRARNESNATRLHRFATDHAEALGLSTDPETKIRVSGFYSEFCQRADPAGSLHTEFVAQWVQRRSVPLYADEPDSPSFDYYGGTTVIFDENGDVRSVIAKSMDGARLALQREFLSGVAARTPGAPFVAPFVPQVSFAALHRGYGGMDGH
jgi:hypothetical protein